MIAPLHPSQIVADGTAALVGRSSGVSPPRPPSSSETHGTGQNVLFLVPDISNRQSSGRSWDKVPDEGNIGI